MNNCGRFTPPPLIISGAQLILLILQHMDAVIIEITAHCVVQSPPPPSHTHTHTRTHIQTPTNLHPMLSSATASTRSIAGSPAVSHDEDFKEILVLAETARNETLLCPLCGGVFRDPYIATCGVSF